MQTVINSKHFLDSTTWQASVNTKVILNPSKSLLDDIISTCLEKDLHSLRIQEKQVFLLISQCKLVHLRETWVVIDFMTEVMSLTWCPSALGLDSCLKAMGRNFTLQFQNRTKWLGLAKLSLCFWICKIDKSIHWVKQGELNSCQGGNDRLSHGVQGPVKRSCGSISAVTTPHWLGAAVSSGEFPWL